MPHIVLELGYKEDCHHLSRGASSPEGRQSYVRVCMRVYVYEQSMHVCMSACVYMCMALYVRVCNGACNCIGTSACMCACHVCTCVQLEGHVKWEQPVDGNAELLVGPCGVVGAGGPHGAGFGSRRWSLSSFVPWRTPEEPA